MSSIDTTVPPRAATTESEPPSKYKGSVGPVVDVALRLSLFGTALVSVIIMVTSKQTTTVSLLPGLEIPVVAKFNQSPSFIYLVAALSVACLYSIITSVVSGLALMKPGGNSTKLQLHFVILDALLLGIVAAATGAAGGVAYIGLKGNSHTGWTKICDKVDYFCVHYAASISLSLVSSIILLLLVWLSVYALPRRFQSNNSFG